MTVKDSAGTGKTKVQVVALMTDVTPVDNKIFSFNGSGVGDGHLYEHSTLPGKLTVDGDRQFAFFQGALYSQAEIDRLFPLCTIDTITPNTGLPAAGGTVLTVKGSNLTGVTSVTFGGTAGTSLVIVSSKELRITTPAKAAATYDVAFIDDAGTVTKTAAVTFV